MIFLNEWNNIKNFFNYIDKIEFPIDIWEIYNKSIEDRTKAISNTTYYKKIYEQAKENKISMDNTEIISWFDNIYLFCRVLHNLKSSELYNVKIYQELIIPFSNKRADMVLCKDNKILIIEFSNNRYNDEHRFENKLLQATSYKELLENILPDHIKIATFTFINKPDKEDNKTNNEEIKRLAIFIKHYFKDTYKSAQEELMKIKE